MIDRRKRKGTKKTYRKRRREAQRRRQNNVGTAKWRRTTTMKVTSCVHGLDDRGREMGSELFVLLRRWKC